MEATAPHEVDKPQEKNGKKAGHQSRPSTISSQKTVQASRRRRLLRRPQKR